MKSRQQWQWQQLQDWETTRSSASAGGSESIPFTFPTFLFDHSGKGKEKKGSLTFPKLLKPFPVANCSFPGKGAFPKIAETFHSCSLSFPFLSSCSLSFPFPVVTFPAFPGNSPLLGPFYRVPLLYITSQWSFIYLCPDWVMGSNPTLSKLISSLSSCFTKSPNFQKSTFPS